MNKVKRLLALLLALCMVFALAACAGDAGTGNTGTKDTTDKSDKTDDAAKTDDGAKTDDTAEPAGEASGTFKLGGIGPLTGEAAIYGNAAMNGAQIAVDEINALGGIQFEFNAQDDEADGEKAINAYNNLKDWGMQVLVGAVTTGSAIAVSTETHNDRVFAITPSASSTDVTAGKDNMYQICFTDPNQGVASADYIAEKMAGCKIAIIYRNDDAYSQGIRDSFKTEAAAKGLEIVYEGTFTADTQTDFNVQLTSAQSSGADLVFLPIYYQPASVIFNQADAMGYEPTFFGVDGMDGILTLEGFNTELAEGLMLLTPFSADDESAQDFVNAYVAAYGDLPSQFAADGYDAVYAIYEAIQASGCTGDMSAEEICEKLVATFPTISVDGLTGSLSWSANGEVTKLPAAYVIRDGKYVAA